MILFAAAYLKRKALFRGAAFCLFALFAGTLFLLMPSGAKQADGTRQVVIPSGASTAEIAWLLAREQVIGNPFLFRLVTRVRHMDNKLQAGEYEFSAHMSVTQVLHKIVQGQTISRSFTIPEGFTVEQIAALLSEKGLVDRERFLYLANTGLPASELLRGNPNGGVGYAVEGFLFPDTYSISKGMREEDILRLLLDKFAATVTGEMRAKAAEQGLDLYQLVTLASLVEREARVEEERPVIAAVFLHRLQIGMPLQSCATIQYILGTPKEELSIQDIRTESPYNTYLHPGLPPGPIANPGLASLQAVINPAQTDVLYFVAKPDGTHVFSRTYDEHLQAIEQQNNLQEEKI